MKFIQMIEPLSQFIKFAVTNNLGFIKQEENARPTIFPVNHLDRQEKQAQRYSLFLRKYSFHINQISSRDYIDIDVSKYHKINLGKTIL